MAHTVQEPPINIQYFKITHPMHTKLLIVTLCTHNELIKHTKHAIYASNNEQTLIFTCITEKNNPLSDIFHTTYTNKAPLRGNYSRNDMSIYVKLYLIYRGILLFLQYLAIYTLITTNSFP